MKMCCMLHRQKILFCLIRPRIQIRNRLTILNNSKKSTDYCVPQNFEGNSHRSVGFKSKQSLRKCVTCGRLHSRHSCPHKKAKCFKCGKMGHIQTVCRSSNCQLTYDAESQVDEITTDISNITLSVVSNSYGHVLKSLKTSYGRKCIFHYSQN